MMSEDSSIREAQNVEFFGDTDPNFFSMRYENQTCEEAAATLTKGLKEGWISKPCRAFMLSSSPMTFSRTNIYNRDEFLPVARMEDRDVAITPFCPNWRTCPKPLEAPWCEEDRSLSEKPLKCYADHISTGYPNNSVIKLFQVICHLPNKPTCLLYNKNVPETEQGLYLEFDGEKSEQTLIILFGEVPFVSLYLIHSIEVDTFRNVFCIPTPDYFEDWPVKQFAPTACTLPNVTFNPKEDWAWFSWQIGYGIQMHGSLKEFCSRLDSGNVDDDITTLFQAVVVMIGNKVEGNTIANESTNPWLCENITVAAYPVEFKARNAFLLSFTDKEVTMSRGERWPHEDLYSFNHVRQFLVAKKE